MEKPKGKMGRPPGKDYPVKKQFRLAQAHAAKLGRLARREGGSESEVVRRLIEKEPEEQ